jgi:transcriptional regulator with XRE-family HTH domain
MSESPHPTDVRVGRLLRERRLELGMSQERLGRLGALLGVTYQQVQKYERGANRIGSSRLHELCRVLGVRASYFFDETSQPGLLEPSSGLDRTGAPEEDAATREARELVQTFSRIADADVRRCILGLVRKLALVMHAEHAHGSRDS